MMKETANFIVGSSAFFRGMDGFFPKDEDLLSLMDEWDLPMKYACIHIDGRDVFVYPDIGKGLIDMALGQEDALPSGKFIVPEFCEHIQMTIDDLKRLEIKFNQLSDKRPYEKYIYDCYITNKGFFLTEAQRNTAYGIYKKQKAI